MSSKSRLVYGTVSSKSSVAWESEVIPNQKEICIKNFGASSTSMSDNESSICLLKFGDEVIRAIVVSNTTYELKLDKTLIGDGIKKLSIVRLNNSSTDRIIASWVDGYIK